MSRQHSLAVAAAVTGLSCLTGGCTAERPDAARGATSPPPATAGTPVVTRPASPTATAPAGSPAGAAAPRLGDVDAARGAKSWLSVPAIGLERLRVVRYRGTADDRPGTRIQDTGKAASPRGPAGGTGPGAVGNFVVTAHRTTAGGPFGRLPDLRPGEHVLVTAGRTVYDYRITRTLRVSFRDPASRASQSAPVPGRPGRPATRPMLTLSTCATPEDRAAGNYWSDALGNPEHRIDKVGVLVDVRPL